MYWTLSSDDPPRCLFPHGNGNHVSTTSMCGEKGRFSDPDETVWTLTPIQKSHPTLAAALKDGHICFDCRVEVVAEHNLPENFVHG